MLKFKKDVLATLATVAAVLVALFAAFVTIPVWFLSVVATLAFVCAIVTVNEIVKAYKASYDEETGKHTYKFPVREVVFGTAILVAVAAIVLLSLKRLFGFALIPVAALLAILFVIALLKKLSVMKWITGLLLAILIVALVGYFTSALVHSGVDLNPGVSAETTTTEPTEDTVPETEVTTPEVETEETIPEEEETEVETEETVTEEEETEVDDSKLENDDKSVVEDKPVEDVVKPEKEDTSETKPEDNYTPVIIKIDAPETISYAQPITIKLEGIDANNLKFGNEDFLYIDIISDSEVEITLIGIVNDAGEVELIPAAGYITVTDSVSGVNVTIEIVE